MNHTREPWGTGSALSNTCHVVFSRNGRTMRRVAQFSPSPYMNKAECEANADRAVACVNACAGMEDPAAEIGRLRAEIGRLEADLKKSRDQAQRAAAGLNKYGVKEEHERAWGGDK